MKALTLRNRFQGNCTIIENDFIDHSMVKANGEYVKVYLLLLRHVNDPDASLTISKIADCLECTEKDILRALNYWTKEGLVKIDYDEDGSVCAITIGQIGQGSAQVGQGSAQVGQGSAQEEEAPAPKKQRKTAEAQDKLRQLYFVAEQYIGKPLSVSDIQKINYFFDTLNFSTDLIEYLIEYCVENGHKSMRYIETVAHAWADEGITTVAQARADSAIYNKTYFAVLKAFGISGRNPAPVEITYIKKWTDEYGFSSDIILEACSRTISNTSRADFKYADTILKNWASQNVRQLSDITRLDDERRQEQAAKKKTSRKSVVISSNRFNNFEGRSYDISSLEQQLLNTRS